MSFTLTIVDETTGAGAERRFALTLPSPTVTVRELIRGRVFDDVRRMRLGSGDAVRGLVQPRGGSSTEPDRVDWHEQAEIAIAAFERGRILVLVDERQVTDLDEEVALRDGATEVTFLRLVPLIGG